MQWITPELQEVGVYAEPTGKEVFALAAGLGTLDAEVLVGDILSEVKEHLGAYTVTTEGESNFVQCGG